MSGIFGNRVGFTEYVPSVEVGHDATVHYVFQDLAYDRC